jgi:hypothetical protein
MIELEEAKKIAFDYLKCSGDRVITKVFDAGDEWIIFAGIPGVKQVGAYGALINKNDGNVKPFKLPSQENFKKLKSSESVYEATANT